MHELKVPLPKNDTPYQNAIAKLLDNRLDIKIPLRELFNADLCPTPFLPLLAWSLSVDVWDDEWTEARKRSVIKASPEVHRIKGTVQAVETALEVFDAGYRIKEWWETIPAGRNGTFHIDVFFDNASDLNSFVLRDKVSVAIKASKPKSRSFTSTFGLQSKVISFVGATAIAHGECTPILARDTLPVFNSNLTPVAVLAVGGTCQGGL